MRLMPIAPADLTTDQKLFYEAFEEGIKTQFSSFKVERADRALDLSILGSPSRTSAKPFGALTEAHLPNDAAGADAVGRDPLTGALSSRRWKSIPRSAR